MSTIAVQDRGDVVYIASDSAATYGDCMSVDCGSKIYSLSDSFHYGLVGSSLAVFFANTIAPLGIEYLETADESALVAAAVLYLKAIHEIYPPGSDEAVLNALVINKNGAYEINGLYVVKVDFHHAIGSGAPYAVAAMDTGVSIESAMEVAVDRDPFTGGLIHVKRI